MGISVDRFASGISLDSWRGESVFSVSGGSHLDDPGMDATADAVLHLDVELGDDVSFEGLAFLKILLG